MNATKLSTRWPPRCAPPEGWRWAGGRENPGARGGSSAYLRESLLRRGIGVDTFETAVPWSEAQALHDRLCETLMEITTATLSGARGKAAVMCHLSHSYPEGACLYFTLVFPQNGNPLVQWRVIKSAVMAAVSEHGGAVSHHHGVGADHAAMAALDRGPLALGVLKSLKSALDPDNLIATGIDAMTGAAKRAEKRQPPLQYDHIMSLKRLNKVIFCDLPRAKTGARFLAVRRGLR